ncbi:two-component system phosphate regulon sensor histidine kinase PhoR [Nicoletella semolina]|uniref:histidine kinase n=1 Tax=Nicoletella semolina TaxID=271160 RepID=A0A4R2N768_9PAST|nr:phosphate regulon sensor histidine kinase PhoR [Nicoletella semolina]MDH2924721.1 PAS domain-containing sensor histidine kinase [Nicoletella semolina]TCP16655.1 two-component system phosphate regulon sensor histidine kinase PhoR [Nicoletella semolina]
MKLKISLKHFILELLIAVLSSWLLSIFAQDFSLWFMISLLILLIWHHYNEFSLLQILNPNRSLPQRKTVSTIEHISQTARFYQARSRKDKIKNLRLLSKFNRQIQALPDALIICETTGLISWCNQGSQELFEFTWDKTALKNIFNIIFYPEFKHYFYQSKRKRPLVLLTHNQRYIEVNLHHYGEENYLIVARDVTSFVRLLHSRQTFLANMNHELRTPLTVLQGYLEMLDPEQDNPAFQKKAIDEMKTQSQRMATMLQQLSVLAKIEHSTNIEHDVVEMSEMILSLKRSTDILNTHQQLIFDIEPNIRIMGDEEQLQSAVLNLIYNAIRHSGEGATIKVSWKKQGKTARFCVSDDGIGIEAKHLAHLTERFYRVDESRSNKTGGSGLGLAIVKHALEQHQTTLEIVSEPQKGSQFAFTIKSELLVSSGSE